VTSARDLLITGANATVDLRRERGSAIGVITYRSVGPQNRAANPTPGMYYSNSAGRFTPTSAKFAQRRYPV
jgi:hypothetical protein